MVDLVDFDNKNVVIFGTTVFETCRWPSKLTSGLLVPKACVRPLYDVYDQDGDGLVSMEEFIGCQTILQNSLGLKSKVSLEAGRVHSIVVFFLDVLSVFNIYIYMYIYTVIILDNICHMSHHVPSFKPFSFCSTSCFSEFGQSISGGNFICRRSQNT